MVYMCPVTASTRIGIIPRRIPGNISRTSAIVFVCGDIIDSEQDLFSLLKIISFLDFMVEDFSGCIFVVPISLLTSKICGVSL